MVKLYIDGQNEWYPVYILRLRMEDGYKEIDLTEEEVSDYLDACERFEKWQIRFSEIFKYSAGCYGEFYDNEYIKELIGKEIEVSYSRNVKKENPDA